MTWTIEERIAFAKADGWNYIEIAYWIPGHNHPFYADGEFMLKEITKGCRVESIKGIPPNPIVGERREIPLYNTIDEIARVEDKFRGELFWQVIYPPFYEDINSDEPSPTGKEWRIIWYRRVNGELMSDECHKSELIARRRALLKLLEKK